jgi:uncharacterized paraquat-inducible protein A
MLDALILGLLGAALLCLEWGVTTPILQLQKCVTFRLLGLTIPILNATNQVTILGAVSDLLGSESIVLGATILLASVILPLAKTLTVGAVWIAWRFGFPGSGLLLRILGLASKWSLTEPFALGVTIVACKLGADLRVTLGPGAAFFLLSIFGSIVATEIVRRIVATSPPPPNSK